MEKVEKPFDLQEFAKECKELREKYKDMEFKYLERSQQLERCAYELKETADLLVELEERCERYERLLDIWIASQ